MQSTVDGWYMYTLNHVDNSCDSCSRKTLVLVHYLYTVHDRISDQPLLKKSWRYNVRVPMHQQDLTALSLSLFVHYCWLDFCSIRISQQLEGFVSIMSGSVGAKFSYQKGICPHLQNQFRLSSTYTLRKATQDLHCKILTIMLILNAALYTCSYC